jgi:hypothetical protein
MQAQAGAVPILGRGVKSPVHIIEEAGWALHPVWTQIEKRRSLAFTWVRTRNSEWLYWLH